MIFTISDIYWEEITQDTTSEYLDIKLQMSKLLYYLDAFSMWIIGKLYKHQIFIPVPFIHFAAKGNFPVYRQLVSQKCLFNT